MWHKMTIEQKELSINGTIKYDNDSCEWALTRQLDDMRTKEFLYSRLTGLETITVCLYSINKIKESYEWCQKLASTAEHFFDVDFPKDWVGGFHDGMFATLLTGAYQSCENIALKANCLPRDELDSLTEFSLARCVGMALLGKPMQELEPYKNEVAKTGNKKEKLLASICEAIVLMDKAKFDRSANEYVAYYKKTESKKEPYLCIVAFEFSYLLRIAQMKKLPFNQELLQFPFVVNYDKHDIRRQVQ